MGLLSIFSNKKPHLGSFEIDAVLESETSKSITLTEFPVEFGANVNDHRIINPDRYRMIGAIPNMPLGFGLNDIGMIGIGAVATAVGGVSGGLISGVSAYLLAGSDEDRSKSAWENLTNLLYSGEPFEIDTGNEILTDMVLIGLDTRKDPEMEDGIIFHAELRKLIVVYTRVVSNGVKTDAQLPEGDTAKNQAAPEVQRGRANTEEVSQ